MTTVHHHTDNHHTGHHGHHTDQHHTGHYGHHTGPTHEPLEHENFNFRYDPHSVSIVVLLMTKQLTTTLCTNSLLSKPNDPPTLTRGTYKPPTAPLVGMLNQYAIM